MDDVARWLMCMWLVFEYDFDSALSEFLLEGLSLLTSGLVLSLGFVFLRFFGHLCLRQCKFIIAELLGHVEWYE